MRLELGTFLVKDAEFGSSTKLQKGLLTVNKEELRQLVLEDAAFSDAEIHIAKPGERTRIIHIRDVVEPRWKVEGPGQVFPGFLGPPVTVGEGKTNRLAGTAVAVVGEIVPGEASRTGETLIDMSGPGAPCGPFGKTINVVMNLKPNPDFFQGDREDRSGRGSPQAQAYQRAATKAALKAAAYLAKATQGLKPDDVAVCELGPCDPSLPKFAALHQQGGITLYGARASLMAGALIHPNESFDGAVIPRGGAALGGAIFLEQNNDVLLELCRLHGKEVNFVGYVIFGDTTPSLEEKERVSSVASKVVRMLGAQAAVFQGVSGGNGQIDMMWTLQKMERAGIKTTLIIAEGGVGPEDEGFIFSVPEADAIVNAGSRFQPIKLPAVQKVIGGNTLVMAEKEWDAHGELHLNVSSIHSSLNVISENFLRTRMH